MAGSIVIGSNDKNDVIHVLGDGTAVPPGFNEIARATNSDDTLDGVGGDDHLIGGGGNDQLLGGAGADILNGGSGIDTASYIGSAEGVFVQLGPQGGGFFGDAQGDALILVENLIGSDFADGLIGDDGANHLFGQDGDDFLNGGAGADQLTGGDGIDTVSYGTSAEAVFAQLGPLGGGIFGDAQGDTFIGIENLQGSDFDDGLIGDGGGNNLSGGDGNDSLTGGGGADQLSGGLGIDTIRYFASDVDGDGDLEGVRVIIGASGTSGEADGDTIADDIENVVGTTEGDDLVGSAFDNQLDGQSGDDDLRGEGGNDTLIGGGGNDDLIGGAGGDRLFGGDGIDTIIYSGSDGVVVNLTTGTAGGGDAQGDVIGSDIENIRGGNGIDFLTGSGVGNVLTGGDGDDGLTGLAGNDVLDGGNGDDVLIGGEGADTLSGGTGIDSIQYGGAVGVTVDLTARIAKNGEAQGDEFSANHGIENILGSDGRDTLTGSAVANELAGGNENDVLSGLGGDDILRGGDGDDVLRGGAGADELNGGGNLTLIPAEDGVDLVTYFGATAAVTVDLSTGKGSNGDAQGDTYFDIDNVNGGTAGDIITGNGGTNVLNGFEGNDVLRGGGGADTLDGGVGVDTASYFTGSAGVVVSLITGKGSGGDAQGDTLTGIENLNGSQGGDSLVGNTGTNALQGFDGNDALTGAGGKDTLTGGLGADRFIYGSVSQSVVGADADRITDFSHVQGDRIDLAAIDANLVAAGDQAFSFIGTNLYTGVAGQLRFAVTNGVTTVAGDVNGDKVSDFHIQLTGALALVATDFVL